MTDPDTISASETAPVPDATTEPLAGSDRSRLSCDHCALPIPPAELVVDEIDGTARNFCCQGCRSAYRIITGSGLGSFYRQRAWAEAGLPAGAFDAAYDNDYLQQFVQADGDQAELTFLLEGVRCATCVWLNEKILGGLDGVSEARVNYGTHRARAVSYTHLTLPTKRIV